MSANHWSSSKSEGLISRSIPFALPSRKSSSKRCGAAGLFSTACRWLGVNSCQTLKMAASSNGENSPMSAIRRNRPVSTLGTGLLAAIILRINGIRSAGGLSSSSS